PVIDLSQLAYAELRFWRWYGESVADDPFELAISDDGGSRWTTLQSDSRPTNAWVQETVVLPMPLTDRMRFRFRGQDLNPSLVEVAIDDLEILGAGPDAGLTLLSSGVLGSLLRLGI